MVKERCFGKLGCLAWNNMQMCTDSEQSHRTVSTTRRRGCVRLAQALDDGRSMDSYRVTPLESCTCHLGIPAARIAARATRRSMHEGM